MTPFFFDGCFAWLHGTPVRGGLGVVICGAWAQEEICTRHGLSALGERLAAAGIPALRFDYRGTADSAPHDLSLRSMEADAARAVAALRQQAGVGPVVLVGLRLGAAAAMAAASGIAGLAGVALLAPVVSGNAYLREMRAAASVNPLSQLDPVPRPDSGKTLNTNGFHWSANLQADVAALDLRAMPAPSAPLLVMPPPRPDKSVDALVGGLGAGGAAATVLPFADYDAFMRDPTTHRTPGDAWARIVDWVAELPRTPVAADSGVRATVRDTLVVDGAEEVPLRFGADEAVFGMLCRPAGTPASRVAALLLHEGSSHHIGNGGAYVPLARALAAAGFASLRMDLRGFGDSLPAPRNPHYDPERQADITAAIAVLKAHGYTGFVGFGLCSGAHTALQAALANDAAVGAAIVNLQKFVWHYGDDVRVKPRPMKRTLRSYLRSLRNPGEWRRVLQGQADLTGTARVLLARGGDAVRSGVAGLFPPRKGSETALVCDQMAALSERGVALHLLFADDDPGLGEIALQFGRGARRLRAFPGVRLTMFPAADHHFNGSSVRDRYATHALAVMRDCALDHDVAVAPLPACRKRTPALIRA